MKRVGNLELTVKEYDFYRGKFRRLCEPKRDSGRLEVPDDIHQKFVNKGQGREDMFEAFIKCDGQKAAQHRD